jgi:signal transduction histidine kinase
MFRSIRWRLVFSYMALTLLTVTLVGVLALTLIDRYAARQEINHLTANAETVARQARPFLWPAPRPLKLYQLAHTSAFLGNVRVRILGPDKQVLADSGEFGQPRELAWIVPHETGRAEDQGMPGVIFALPVVPGESGFVPKEMQQSLIIAGDGNGNYALITVQRRPSIWGDRIEFEEHPDLSTPSTVETQGDKQSTFWQLLFGDESNTTDVARSQRSVIIPIQDSLRIYGYVELSNSPDFAGESLRTVRRALVVAGFGVGLLAVLMGLFVSRGLTAPLQSLSATARRMSSGDLSARAPVQKNNDEIGEVALQFNQMADRLQASFEELAAERDALRRFIADASHELRTPITALKQFVELLQGAAADDPTARAEFLAESEQQIDRLAWITANLLDLSRLDANLIDLDISEHDAAELITASMAPFKARAAERNIEMTAKMPDEAIHARCDRGRIELALSNLLDNALKYTSPGGHVTVGVDTQENTVRFWVTDDGPGIDAIDLPRIFDRFYRGRNRTVDGEAVRGTGLGLAIVQSIVQAHGGTIHVERMPEHGSRFIIDLPASHRTPAQTAA